METMTFNRLSLAVGVLGLAALAGAGLLFAKSRSAVPVTRNG